MLLNLTTCLLCAQLLFIAGGPKISFEETKHDFGEKAERSKVEFKFEFTNEGDAPLVIKSHETSCHCTSALYPKHPIMPGESNSVIVKYDATKVGKFHRKVTLYTNAGNEKLTIKGEIVKSKKKVNPFTGE